MKLADDDEVVLFYQESELSSEKQYKTISDSETIKVVADIYEQNRPVKKERFSDYNF